LYDVYARKIKAANLAAFIKILRIKAQEFRMYFFFGVGAAQGVYRNIHDRSARQAEEKRRRKNKP